jgi:hypothetical protein
MRAGDVGERTDVRPAETGAASIARAMPRASGTPHWENKEA